MKIRYKIDDKSKMDTFVQGGLLFEHEGIILTKARDRDDDEGYRGDYIFYNILCILDAIPDILNGHQRTCKFIDYLASFIFVPDGTHLNIIYRNLGKGTIIEKENVLYPGEGKGYSVPLADFVSQFVELSEQFIEELTSQNDTLIHNSDVQRFGKSLTLAKDACTAHEHG